MRADGIRNGNGTARRNGSRNRATGARRLTVVEEPRTLDEFTSDALEAAMAAGLTYVGLRGVVVDRLLLHYVPLSLAVREQIVPLILVGDTLTIASTRPDPDIGPITRRFPKLTIELVIAPAREISELLVRCEDPAGDVRTKAEAVGSGG
jgi:hypothetical protein